MEISAKLLKDCQRGDRKAQFQLYKCSYTVLLSVCLRYQQDEASAVAMLNEGFLKILTNIDKYRPETSFVAWTKRIMINTLIDDFRKNRKVKELIESVDFSSTEPTTTNFDWNEADKQFDAEQLEYLIRQLPPMSCKVFNLYAIDGYSHREIAELLNISEGTSKWHVSSARQKLMELLKKSLNTSRVI
ncbi:MAG: DNA-directed RNA polymerase sigma-70 factor [Saprospiraceae bacterium]|nr:MAG: DNA-directed RNA polymerase sigma-70 factor [Saprospiraceae bacterium]